MQGISILDDKKLHQFCVEFDKLKFGTKNNAEHCILNTVVCRFRNLGFLHERRAKSVFRMKSDNIFKGFNTTTLF